MAITANVVDGVLDYTYTDSSSSTTSGTDMGYEQFLQLLCAEMQYQDPLEPTTNTEYVAQLATFSQLEATLALQDSQDKSFASTLVGKDVILAVESSSGSTSYVTGTVDYVMYKDGTPYLSVNDNLYPFSDLDTIADSGYYEAVSLAKTFSTMVGTLPSKDKISAQYEGAVQEVRDLYDGMTTYQKQFVDADTLASFEAIESRVKELVAANNAAQEGSTEDETAEESTETAETTGIADSAEAADTTEAAETLSEDALSPETIAALTEDPETQAAETQIATEEA
jgi:flagellar basal-body rod modification protein FlgD